MSLAKVLCGLCLVALWSFSLAGCNDLKGDAGKDGVSGKAGIQGNAGSAGGAGAPGAKGTAAVTPTAGLKDTFVVTSTPTIDPNFYSATETVTLKLTLTTNAGDAVGPSDLTRANLYLYGPQDPSKTKTAMALLGASADRDATNKVHHYVSLIDIPNTDPTKAVTADSKSSYDATGKFFTFTTNAIGTEDAGTYRAVVWAGGKSGTTYTFGAYDQVFAKVDFQVKTVTAEAELVSEDNCAKCHKGADNGVFYFHHADSAAYKVIDSAPVKNCKACHNLDGYAAYTDPNTATTTKTKVPDPIVKRIHGVHNGDHLQAPEDTLKISISNVTGGSSVFTKGNWIVGATSGATALIKSSGTTYMVLAHAVGSYEAAWKSFMAGETLTEKTTKGVATGVTATFGAVTVTGIFEDYLSVVFPANVMNCTYCHVDDRWKDKPHRLACGSCHDRQWFGDPAATPDGWKNHAGGQQNDDTNCTTCHPATGTPSANLAPIVEGHAVPPPDFKHTIALSWDAAPANTTHFLSGETPKLVIQITDKATSQLVDPATITEAAYSRVNVFVSGPRNGTKPVLTTAAASPFATARASATNGTAAPWDLSGNPTFVLDIDKAGAMTLTAAVSRFATPIAATAAEVVAWLNDEAAFNAKATASLSGTTKVTIKSKLKGAASEVGIQASTVATKMGWTVASNVAKTGTYAANDYRVRTDPVDEDPKVTRDSTNKKVFYQLDDVAGLKAGTYTVWVELRGLTGVASWTKLNFQVGTATADKYIAKNCTDCHGTTTMHASYFAVDFDTDICKSCHDYSYGGLQGVAVSTTSGKNDWTTSNWGWGAAPIARRVHGVHRGHYLDYPREVHGTYDYSGVIFPQDIRNCTKCHSDGKNGTPVTTGSWNTEPSRLICGSCHDNDPARAHMDLNTIDATPAYNASAKTGGPWSGDEAETCKVCHGAGREYEAKKVHNISDPYKAPYKR